MASDTPSKSQWRALRRYALAGQKEDALRLLEDLHKRYPGNSEVTNELHRLRRGEPLHAAETPAQTQARLINEAITTLQTGIRYHSQEKLALMPNHELREHHKNLLAALRTIKTHNLIAPSGTNAYIKRLEHVCHIRRQQKLKRLLAYGAIVLILVVAMAAVLRLLAAHSQNLAEKLESAHKAGDWSDTSECLREADSFLWQRLNPDLPAIIDRARRWLAEQQKKARELANAVNAYKDPEACKGITPQLDADMRQNIRALPDDLATPLLARWDNLLAPYRDQLNSQRRTFLYELHSAQDPIHFTGQADRDSDLLNERNRQLNSLIHTFADIAGTYELPPETILPAKKQLVDNESILKDIQQYREILRQLDRAQTWRDVCRVLGKYHATTYRPALDLAKKSKTLASEEKIAGDLRTYLYKLPAELHADAVKSLQKNGSNFTRTYPASAEQVELMRDTFTSQTLRRRLYELVHEDGHANYADTKRPEVTASNVSYTMSTLDPEFNLNESRERRDPDIKTIRTIDASPLLAATGIDPNTFFFKANIPHLLGRVTTVRNKTCPALAKAYLYSTLLKLMEQHTAPHVIGLEFSPTLQKDMASFRAMEAACRVPLTVDVWLRRSNASVQAEEMCSRWFAQHTNRDYAAEIAKNFTAAFNVKPVYLGYVDLQGQPHFCRQPAASGRVIYYRQGALTSTPANEPLQEPDPLSILIAD